MEWYILIFILAALAIFQAIRIGTPLRSVVGWSIVLVLSVPLIAGVLILGLQIFGWLISGDWVSFSALEVLSGVTYLLGLDEGQWWGWLSEPTAWLGVWEILKWLPASGFLIVLSWSLIITVLSFID